MIRNKLGQNTRKLFKHSDFRGLYLGVFITTLSYLVWDFYNVVEPFSPLVSHSYGVAQVQASEEVVRPLTIEEKVRAMFPEEPDKAVAIAKCESGMRANAFNGKNTNGSWDAGVMQINSVHKYSKEYLFDVDNNLKVARKLYDRQGFNPWVCARKIK